MSVVTSRYGAGRLLGSLDGNVGALGSLESLGYRNAVSPQQSRHSQLTVALRNPNIANSWAS